MKKYENFKAALKIKLYSKYNVYLICLMND